MEEASCQLIGSKTSLPGVRPRGKWQDLYFRRLHHLDRCRMQQLDCLGSVLQVQVSSPT